MTFAVSRRESVYVLEDADIGMGIEVHVVLGFNCARWFTSAGNERTEWLFCTEELLEQGRPTRFGVPILFPFPNRIRDGQFSWEGKAYQLPVNDPANRNAIHGFACRYPWRVVDDGANANEAWVTGEFQASVDAPEVVALWPADYCLRVTYRLWRECLRIEATVRNPETSRELPFGLGYHPYFRVVEPTATRVQIPARQYWELEAALPTGKKKTVAAGKNLTCPRWFHELTLDDVLTDLDRVEDVLQLCGSISQRQTLSVRTTTDFREVVVFTPPHRQAICIEPYTCVTDAINLQAKGLDAGWQVLPPGGSWSSVVELVVSSPRN